MKCSYCNNESIIDPCMFCDTDNYQSSNNKKMVRGELN